jgi:ATP-binding cassette subfamily B protein
MMTPGGAKNTKKALGALLHYCQSYAVIMVAALVFAAVSAVLSVIGPDYISKLTETITSGVSPTGISIDLERIGEIAAILIAIYAVSMLLGYLQSMIMTQVSCKVGKTMRSDITGKINRIPLRYFDSHNYGDTLSRVTNDVDTIT